MKTSVGERRSRRKFMSLGLLGSLGLFTKNARAAIPTPEYETVKMLTAEGELVEVRKEIVSNAVKRKKARNRDILAWAKTMIK